MCPKLLSVKGAKFSIYDSMGSINALGTGDLHMCKVTTDAEALIGILERLTLSSSSSIFPEGVSSFQRENARPPNLFSVCCWY